MQSTCVLKHQGWASFFINVLPPMACAVVQSQPYTGLLTPAPRFVFMGSPHSCLSPDRVFMETWAGFLLTHVRKRQQLREEMDEMREREMEEVGKRMMRGR